ncbi:MAG: hypothetical protein ISR55_06780 [Bacteroidetes bacterium]|nr:hypothetical protein [Bacteroidota bacterium]MBL6963509.1 hypothetical protein [Bacteroidota bacterium]
MLFIAGTVWFYAAYRVFLVLMNELIITSRHVLIYVIGGLVYLVFFQTVFHKILIRHTRRIIRKEKNWLCLFSFFDWRSYLLMAIMISAGILTSKYATLPPSVMAAFFISLSLSLFTSAIYFVYYGIRFSYTKSKFSNINKLQDEN